MQSEFGKTLGDPDVHILDPCTGTGNFIVNLLRRIPKKDLPRMYRQQLFANEVMLLPYYIAALNIEHAYYELTGEYEPFHGLCFVDTLELAKGQAEHVRVHDGGERAARGARDARRRLPWSSAIRPTTPGNSTRTTTTRTASTRSSTAA